MSGIHRLIKQTNQRAEVKDIKSKSMGPRASKA